jgi:hypothetical protein
MAEESQTSFRHTDWDTIINDDDSTNKVCINFTDKFLTRYKNVILKHRKARRIHVCGVHVQQQIVDKLS